MAKLSAEGGSLVFATFLGGNQAEQGNGIALDALGNAYVIGSTQSANFPTTAGVVQPTYYVATCRSLAPGGSISHPCDDVFITKLNPAGNALVYSTLLGGDREDFGAEIAVDDAGNVLVTGASASSNFPLTPVLFATPFIKGETRFTQAFVAKLNPTVTELIYSIRGIGGNSIATDADGNAYVYG